MIRTVMGNMGTIVRDDQKRHMMKGVFSVLLLAIPFVHSFIAQAVQKTELIVQTGHTFPVQHLAFDTSGKILVTVGDGDFPNVQTGSWIGVIKLWEMNSGKEVRSFMITKEMPEWYRRVPLTAILMHDDLLAMGFVDGTIRIFDINTRKLVLSDIKTESEINSLGFDRLAQKLVSCHQDGRLIVWDTQGYTPIFDKQFATAKQCGFSPNGNFLTVSTDTSTLVIDALDYRTLHDLTCESGSPDSNSFQGGPRPTFSRLDDSVLGIPCDEGKLEIHDLVERRRSASIEMGFVPNSIVSASVRNELIIAGYANEYAPIPTIASVDLTVHTVGQIRQLPKTALDPDRNIPGPLLLSPGGSFLARISQKWSPDLGWFGPPCGTRDPAALHAGSSYSQKLVKSVFQVSTTTDLRDVNLTGKSAPITEIIAVDPRLGVIHTGGWEKNKISIWNMQDRLMSVTEFKLKDEIAAVALSPDYRFLAAASASPSQSEVRIWDLTSSLPISVLETDLEIQPGSKDHTLTFNRDGTKIAIVGNDHRLISWDFASPTGLPEPRRICTQRPYYVNPVEPELAAAIEEDGKKWDLEAHKVLNALENAGFQVKLDDRRLLLIGEKTGTVNGLGEVQVVRGKNGSMEFLNRNSKSLIARLINLDEGNWVVVGNDGRFDTNMSLENIDGLHWIVNNEILKPVPLEAFMRQYYEPGLLKRLMKCNEEGGDACDKEFKPLPSIAEINRVQPRVEIEEITPIQGSDDLVNVKVTVQSITENVTISADDHRKKEEKTSGAYDLRLFRDGQLIGVSSPAEKLEEYIAQAPELLTQAQPSDKVMQSPEDIAWRKANVIIPETADVTAYTGSSCAIDPKTPTNAVCTFPNVKLPRNGNTNIEFSAYAFNTDRVKSETARKTHTIDKPQTRLGRAIVLSIGVNSTEGKSFDLQYAAADARLMQKVLIPKLDKEVEAKRYSEVVSIPFVSDYETKEHPEVNNARKPVIKGVFSLLAGVSMEDVVAEIAKQDKELAQAFKDNPDFRKIKPVEPEDTLIISFAGHGYADRTGIFYLMPNDIGPNVSKLTTDVLGRLISSDELSIWMQNITASEMIMVIDACHSAAAIQGDGFKPGPMGSRGLGQLAYDKGMRILSATQADNVAIELSSLKQGILSYTLLEDGINKKLADTQKKGELTAQEWLGYAVQAVPKLYEDVRAGRRSVILNARNTEDWKLKEFQSGDLFFDTGEFERRLGSVQQPTVFDFRRRDLNRNLFSLK
jgi:WD40 repeat protein/uncharacterized caspase-like protein